VVTVNEAIPSHPSARSDIKLRRHPQVEQVAHILAPCGMH
jgi:hypothetical protein